MYKFQYKFLIFLRRKIILNFLTCTCLDITEKSIKITQAFPQRRKITHAFNYIISNMKCHFSFDNEIFYFEL